MSIDETRAADCAPGDSAAQRECEEYILQGVEQLIGSSLAKTRLQLPNGGLLELDGCSEDCSVLCEAWAHQGKVRPAQKSKVVTDAAKLFLAGEVIGGSPRKILAFADREAATWFAGRSWMSQLLLTMQIETMVVGIPDDIRARVAAAQKRQYR